MVVNGLQLRERLNIIKMRSLWSKILIAIQLFHLNQTLNWKPTMPNPDALWEDIQKLDDLYEELLWDPDDELQFTHDGEKIIIINKTQSLKYK